MAMTASERAELDNLKAQFAAFQAGTVAVASMTGQQRKTFENTTYPILNGYRNRKGATNYDYTAWEVGDEVMNISTADKQMIVGKVIAVPFNPTTDLNDRAKFDWYIDQKPKL